MERVDLSSQPEPWQSYRKDLLRIQFPQEMTAEDEVALFAYLNQAVVMFGELTSELRVSPEGEIQARPRHNPQHRPDPEIKWPKSATLSHTQTDFNNFRHGFEQLGLTPPPPDWGDRRKETVANTVSDQMEATRTEFLSIPSSHDLPIIEDSGQSPKSEPVATTDECAYPDQEEVHFDDRLHALLDWFNQQLASGKAMEPIRRWHQVREEAKRPKPKHQPGSETDQDW